MEHSVNCIGHLQWTYNGTCTGHVQHGCVSVNDIARTHPLQATDDGSLHGQSAAEKRRRRRRCGDDGLSHKRRGSTTDVCRRHLVYPPPFVRVKIRYTRPDVFSESSCIRVLYRCPRSRRRTGYIFLYASSRVYIIINIIYTYFYSFSLSLSLSVSHSPTPHLCHRREFNNIIFFFEQTLFLHTG